MNLTLSGPTGGASLGATSAAVLTIVDNDAMADAAATAPTLNEWGMIIFMLFAGILSIHYLKRQMRM